MTRLLLLSALVGLCCGCGHVQAQNEPLTHPTITREDGSLCRVNDLMGGGKMGTYGCLPAPLPMFVPALEGDEMVDSGTSSCHAPKDPKWAGVVECTTNLVKEHYIRCTDKSRILLTAEDGKHWCMAVNQ
jgi:hypothetical protein